jgi:hypothetical protein
MSAAKEIRDHILKRGQQKLHTRVESGLGRNIGCTIHFTRNSSSSASKKGRIEFDIHPDGSAIFSDELVNKESEKLLYSNLKQAGIDSWVNIRNNALSVNFSNEKQTLDRYSFSVIEAVLKLFKKEGVIFELELPRKVDTVN